MRRLLRLVSMVLVLSLSACADGQVPQRGGWPDGVPTVGEPVPADARPTPMAGLPGVRASGAVYTLGERPFSVVEDHGVVVAVAAFAWATPDGVRVGDAVDSVRALSGVQPDGGSGVVERLRLPSGWVAIFRPSEATIESVVWEGAPLSERAWPGDAVPALGVAPPGDAWPLDPSLGGRPALVFGVAIDAAFSLVTPPAVTVGTRTGRVVSIATHNAQVQTPEGARLGLSAAEALALAAGSPEPAWGGGLRVPLESGWVAVLDPSRLMVTHLVWERPGVAPGLDGAEVGGDVPADAQRVGAPLTPGARLWPERTQGLVRDDVGYVLGLRDERVAIVQVASPGFATPDGVGPGSSLADAVDASPDEFERAGPGLRRLRLSSGWDALVRDGEEVVYRVSLEDARD